MPLSWNEIRDRAAAFSRRWQGAASEQAEAQTFWNEFLNVFGIGRRQFGVFEKRVAKLDGKPGRIDFFWPGVLLAEHKSAGRDLDAAFTQALDYEEFGMYFARIPLKSSPHIVHGNALQLEWAEIMPDHARQAFILGNPPFIGAKFLSDEQRADAMAVFGDIPNAGLLDYVAAWYVKAAHYMTLSPLAEARHPSPASGRGDGGEGAPRAAFVSTNSITQGEQVGVLWSWMLAKGMHIHFAHRIFQWSNEARGVAAVHCVIVGFGAEDRPGKVIYDYEDIKGGPHAIAARNINPYLVDAADIVVGNRERPLCAVPEIGIGNKPIDGGHYLFTPEEKDEFIEREQKAGKWFRRWIGSDEFINGYERWCLWLGECPPDELKSMPFAMQRVEAVRNFRLASKSAPTRKLANTPTRFHVENIPDAPFLVIPEVSSERRPFIASGA
jgi:hypothetical protein